MTAKNKLGVFDLTMIVVSLVIGMGIFRTPANVAASSPTPLIFYMAWILGGVVALCGALTYAEIGSRLPVTGGYYKVFAYAYHPSVAFAINCIILVSNAASGAGVALVGGEYITSVLFPHEQDPALLQNIHIIIAIGAIAIFYGVNMLGLRMSAKTQSVLTVIKITLVLLLITPLFFSPAQVNTSTILGESLSPGLREYIKAFGLGLVGVSFTYGGYQQTINFGAEVRNPARNMPRGIFFGIALIITLYLVINYAYVHVIGFEQLKTTKNIATVMASKVFGVNAERILAVFLFLSVLAYINALLLSNPRVMYAMCDDQILPAVFKKQNAKGALTLALTVFAVLAALIVFWAKEFDKLLQFTIFLDSFGMVLSAGSLFIIRKRTRHLDGTGIFTRKWIPALTILFMAAYTFVAISIFRDTPRIAWQALGVLAAFILLYFLIKAFKKSNTIS